jgi:hypothetical protein
VICDRFQISVIKLLYILVPYVREINVRYILIHYITYKPIIGPSGVRALPLAAGINVVAIVLGIIFLLSSFRGPYSKPQKGLS